METTIAAELLELKARFDQWRATRKYNPPSLATSLWSCAGHTLGVSLSRLSKTASGAEPPVT